MRRVHACQDGISASGSKGATRTFDLKAEWPGPLILWCPSHHPHQAAGMTCVVTKSSYTSGEDFTGADQVHDCIGEKGGERFSLADLAKLSVQSRLA